MFSSTLFFLALDECLLQMLFPLLFRMLPLPPQLLRQLAATSMQTLHTIVTASSEINVDTKEDFHFHPKTLLRHLVLIVLNNR
jgi:hypothetical protein